MKSFLALMLVLCVGFVAQAQAPGETGPGPTSAATPFLAKYYAATGNLYVSSSYASEDFSVFTEVNNYYIESSNGSIVPLASDPVVDLAAMNLVKAPKPTQPGQGQLRSCTDVSLMPGFAQLALATQQHITVQCVGGAGPALSNNANRRGLASGGFATDLFLGSLGPAGGLQASALDAGSLSVFYSTGTGSSNAFRVQAGSPGFTIVPVPEPASIGLVGLGVAGLLAARRRS